MPTMVMPAVGPRHRRRTWWDRWWPVLALVALGPLAIAGGVMLAAMTAPRNAGYVPYAAGPGVPVALGPARPTMATATNTERPVTDFKAPLRTVRYSPTRPPAAALTAAITPRAFPVPATPRTSSPGHATTEAPTPSPSPTSAPPAPASTTATPSPPATPAS